MSTTNITGSSVCVASASSSLSMKPEWKMQSQRPRPRLRLGNWMEQPARRVIERDFLGVVGSFIIWPEPTACTRDTVCMKDQSSWTVSRAGDRQSSIERNRFDSAALCCSWCWLAKSNSNSERCHSLCCWWTNYTRKCSLWTMLLLPRFQWGTNGTLCWRVALSPITGHWWPAAHKGASLAHSNFT